MNITVVIPVIDQKKMTGELCTQMLSNTVLPTEVIIIDNGSRNDDYRIFTSKFQKLNLRIIRFEENIGVNAAWNLGITESKTELISVLNNDIVISRFFFQKILETFEDPKTGIAIPVAVKDIENVHECTEERSKLQEFKSNEAGFAWTIRASVARRIKPIPSKLFLYGGDNYMFLCNSALGFRNFKMMNNFIYHYGKITTRAEFPGGFPTHGCEKATYRKISSNIKKYIEE
jgi:GT2 family glycosyltransferase